MVRFRHTRARPAASSPFRPPEADTIRPVAKRDRIRKQKEAMAEQAKTQRANICGASKRNGRVCRRAAGWGTDHAGTGRCKHHAGATPSGQLSAAREEVRNLATPIDVAPGQVLISLMNLAAGQLAYVTQKVGELPEEKLFVDSIGGKIPNHWVRLQRTLMLDLKEYAKTAAGAGIDERMTRLAEEQAQQFNAVLEAVMEEVGLSSKQRAKVGPAIRGQLVAIQGGAEEAA